MVQEKPFDDQQGGDKEILDGKGATGATEAVAPGEKVMAEDPSTATLPRDVEAAASSAGVESHAVLPPRRSSTPAMIGAGILGGLVALAAAGSMQYAGYLPAASPETGTSSAAPASSEMDALRAEIDGLKQQLATIPADLAPTTDLEKRIAALEARPSGTGEDPEAKAKLDELEQRLVALQQASTNMDSAASRTIADLTARLDSAEKTLKERPGEAAVSRTIAATYLKAAVDRGEPFLTELETFSALAPEDPAIAGLKPLAANGIPSRSALSGNFYGVAKAIVNAVNQPVAGEGWTDRLLSSARSLVSIRPVGNVEGTDAGAILARIEERLKNGDLKGASLEWEALPEAGRLASEDFKRQLDDRIKADELTGALVDRARSSALQAG